jgi:hypothetical protein
VISIRDENNKVMNEARENARDILRNTLTEIIYSQEQTEEEKYSKEESLEQESALLERS